MAYQAKTWLFTASDGRFSGQDLNSIIEKQPSLRVCKMLAKTINRRLTISPREIIHIIDSQSVSRAVKSFRRLIPSAFPSKLCYILFALRRVVVYSLLPSYHTQQFMSSTKI